MKLLGEVMRRDPNPEERESLLAVVEIARAWERGDVDLRGVRSACTGRDRWQAMRFAELRGDDKVLLMNLVDALLAEEPTVVATDHGLMGVEEVYQSGVKKVTNHAGERVIVWPTHWMDGEPVYPRFDLPPGEERRKHEEAATGAYTSYRDAKKREGRP